MTSWTISSGSRIAAPCSGGMASARSGVDDHADAGKAAFAETEQDHGGNGQQIE